MYIALLLGILLLDQATKIIVAALNSNNTVINGLLSFSYVENPGAAFSILTDAPWARVFFICITSVAITVMIVIFAKSKSKFLKFSLVTLIAGAAGNLIDRIAFGYVRDFIFVHFFANFNIADIAVTVGVSMIIFYLIFLSDDALIKIKKKKADEDRKADS